MQTQCMRVCVYVCGAGPPMMARLARSGQSALVIGHLLVVTGGILRDISLYVDIVIMNLNTLAFIRSAYHTCQASALPLLFLSQYICHATTDIPTILLCAYICD